MPNCRIIFAETFDKDLRKIASYLIENDFDADKVIEIRRKTEEILSKFPEIGGLYREKNNIRKIVVLRKNTIYYQVVGAKIYVLHIFAGKMDKNFD